MVGVGEGCITSMGCGRRGWRRGVLDKYDI